MALSRLKAVSQLSAVRKFTDRDGSRDAFSRALDSFDGGSANLHVLSFYGVGGIGKTRLIRYLHDSLLNRADLRIASIDLEGPQFVAPHDVLLELRRQLGYRCDLFEYAVARVLAITGRTLDDLNTSLISEDSLLYDFQEVACDLVGITAPARLLKKVFDKLSDTRRRYLTSLKSEILAIDSIPDTEITSYLPYYLGKDIRAGAKRTGKKPVVFFDTFEALDRRSGFYWTKGPSDYWISELIGASEFGLYVIGGRNHLNWADSNPEWEQYLEQHSLGHLSDHDAEFFLSAVPVEEYEVRLSIIESAKGVPLYLDLCASTYLIRKKCGDIISAEDFRMHETEVIQRFLAHLDPEHQEALKIMAVVNCFDHRLFCDLMERLNIPFPFTLFDEFCEKSYAEQINKEDGVYRIHAIVREYMADEAATSTVEIILGCLVSELEEDIDAYRRVRAAWVVEQIFECAKTYGVFPKNEEFEGLFKALRKLIDAGRWLLVRPHIEYALNKQPRVVQDGKTFLTLLLAYCARKEGELNQADELYRELAEEVETLGLHKPLYEYLSAHTRHLLGHFNDAMKVYEKLGQTEVSTKSSITDEQAEVYFLSRRQYADVLMMRGKFDEALRVFNELQSEYSDDAIWQSEVLRFRGHVYRFNFLLADAETIYDSAKEIALRDKAGVMQAKALTNLAETLCWRQPEEGVRIAEEAIEANKDVSAPIEIGKATAALSLALSNCGKYKDAHEVSLEAVKIQEDSGYRAGRLFGLEAEAYSLALSGQPKVAQSVLRELDAEAKVMGVYRFLGLPARAVLQDKETISKFVMPFDWLQLSNTILEVSRITGIDSADIALD